MREKKLLKEFFRYVSQNVLGMIGLSCYILADTFFIARGLGTKGLTALNLAIPVYSFVNGCGLMLGMGGATKYSIFRGQKGKSDIFSRCGFCPGFCRSLYAYRNLFIGQTCPGLGGGQRSF